MPETADKLELDRMLLENATDAAAELHNVMECAQIHLEPGVDALEKADRWAVAGWSEELLADAEGVLKMALAIREACFGGLTARETALLESLDRALDPGTAS